jgi:hypothetical protein
MKVIAENKELSVTAENNEFWVNDERRFSNLDSLCRFLLKQEGGEEILDIIFRLDEVEGWNAPTLVKACYDDIELLPSYGGCKLTVVLRYDGRRVKHFVDYRKFLRWNSYMKTRNGLSWDILEAYAATLLS